MNPRKNHAVIKAAIKKWMDTEYDWMNPHDNGQLKAAIEEEEAREAYATFVRITGAVRGRTGNPQDDAKLKKIGRTINNANLRWEYANNRKNTAIENMYKLWKKYAKRTQRL